MAYTKQTWADLPSKTTPINATRLGHIEDGIFNAAATADNAASSAGTAVSQIGQVSSRVDTLTDRVNGLDIAVSNKVDKVTGKGLSTNDYDDTDKGKVDSLGTASTKNSTSVVTESSDLVESGAVYDALGFGNKNVLENKATSQTIVGISFTVNADKSITANETGTHSSSSYLIIDGGFASDRVPLPSYLKKSDSYIISDIKDNVSVIIYFYDSEGGTISSHQNSEFTVPSTAVYFGVFVYVGSSVHPSNVTVYPMIRKASVTDPTYEPYHASVSDSLDTKMSYADNGVLGAKQFLPLSLKRIKELNSGRTWNGNSCSHNGITFTVNVDSKGSVTSISISGTSTAFAFLRLASVSKLSGSFKLNGGISADVFVYIRNETTDTQVVRTGTGDVDVNLSPTNDIINCIVGINPNNGGTNTIYPMLRLATDTDPTYQPYAQTNRELTVNKADNSVIGTVEDGTTASQAYAVGEHFIRNGKFCTVTQAISSGGTLTEGTNYTSGSIADVIGFIKEVRIGTFNFSTNNGFATKNINFSIPFSNNIDEGRVAVFIEVVSGNSSHIFASSVVNSSKTGFTVQILMPHRLRKV